MKKISSVLFVPMIAALIAVPSHAYSAVVVPGFLNATKVNVTVVCQTSFVSNSRTFVETYRITSDPSSAQSAAEFAITVGCAPLNSTSAYGWSGDKYIDRSLWSWTADYDNTLLAPGGGLGGFSLTSSCLPAIQPYYVQGDIPIPNVNDVPEGVSEREFADALEIPNNSFQGTTISPGSIPASTSPSQIESFLGSQLQQAVSLGWIDSNGILNSLRVKLDAANDSISRGDHVSARHQLDAFSHELEAQAGKHVTAQAAEFLGSIAQCLESEL